MADPLQPIKIEDDYTVSASDCGLLLEVVRPSTITFEFGLPGGFYITIVNAGGGTVALVAAGGGTIRSVTGATSLTAQWQATTVYKRTLTNEFVAMGMS